MNELGNTPADKDYKPSGIISEEYPEKVKVAYLQGYEQAEKDTIVEVEKWLKAEFHHRNCWNADEFCNSLRTYFGIKK